MPDEIKSGIRLRENTYEAEIKQRKKSIFIFDICRTIDAFLFSSNSHPADLQIGMEYPVRLIVQD